MAKPLSKSKGRSDNGPSFTKLVHHYFQSAEYAELSSRSVKLLVDLNCQYRGDNNGDLCVTLSVLKKVGWTSNDQLQKALVELLATGWLIVTRRGGRKMASLYALTTLGIDHSIKLDSHIRPSPTPLNLWKHCNRQNIILDESIQKRWAEISAQKKIHCTATRPTGMPPHGSNTGKEARN